MAIGWPRILGWLALCLLMVGPALAADRASRAADRVRPLLLPLLAQAQAEWGAPVFIRAFKLESEMELWVQGQGGWMLFKRYPICAWSGDLGPKLAQGDRQTPEGIYRVGAGQLNPASSYHLSFNLGYPNALDRYHGRTGDYLMVHGSCVSIGCYAMTHVGIEEIYTLVAAALSAGQRRVDVHLFPFRLEAAQLAAQHDHRWFEFWSELQPIYAAFERDHQPPSVAIVDGHYRMSNP